MRFLFTIMFGFFLINCTNITQKSDISPKSNKLVADSSIKKSIRKIDFDNFSYPWTESFNGSGKTFTLVDGKFSEKEGRDFSLNSILYEDERSFVTIRIGDGNADYHILYIYEIRNNEPKLVQTFEFNETNNGLLGIYIAHGELIIEQYKLKSGDAQCCPGGIERKHFEWRDDKFVLISTQQISNDFIERQKNKNLKTNL